MMKHLKNTKLYSIKILRTEIMSDPREFSPDSSYPLFQSEESDVISMALYSISVYLSNSNHILVVETL